MCCSKILGSLCSCFGSGKKPSVGRTASVALLVFAVLISVALQYWVAPYIKTDKLDFAWGCDDVEEEYYQACRGNMAVMRVSFVTMVFFLLSTFGALLHNGFNRSFWGLKFAFYMVMLLGVMFVPSAMFQDDGAYVKIAQIGGCIFIVLQQIILIDMAYNWNDAWVANADADEAQEMGSGDVWLKSLLAISFVIFVLSWVGIGLLFHNFSGCTENSTFIGLTLALTLVATIIQLTGDEGSMLTSAILTMYSVYLCYSAVSLNPDTACNPTLGNENYISLMFGIVLLTASIAWTGYSASTNIPGIFEDDDKPLVDGQPPAPSSSPNTVENGEKKTVTGIVTDGQGAENYGAAGKGSSGGEAFDGVRNSITGDGSAGGGEWKLNVVLVLLTLWYPCILTDWGAIKNEGNIAKPNAGETAMWMQFVAMCVALGLYAWTLLAPRLFPDREFS